MNNIIIIGNSKPPVNGVTVILDLILRSFKLSGIKPVLIKTNTSSKLEDFNFQGSLTIKKLLLSINIFLKGIFILCSTRNAKLVYMVPGESLFGFFRFVPFMIISKILKKNIILHFHGELFLRNCSEYHPTRKKIIIKCLSLSDRIILLGNIYLLLYSEMFPQLREKFIVCKNGISDKLLIPKDLLHQKLGSEIKTINILYLSNLLKSKGILDLIESIPYLERKNLSFKVHICGAIEPCIKNTVELLFNKYSNYIEYYGLIEGEKKKSILQNCHVFCLPTYMDSEAQPLSIMEAMANANVIVTTNHGGIPDIFKEGVNGFYCEKRNPESIAEAIYNAFKNFSTMGLNNYIEFTRFYSEEAFFKRFSQILKE